MLIGSVSPSGGMSSSPPVSRRQVWLLLVKTFSIGALGYYLFWLVNSTKTDDSFISARTLSPERWMALEWARQEGHKVSRSTCYL